MYACLCSTSLSSEPQFTYLLLFLMLRLIMCGKVGAQPLPGSKKEENVRIGEKERGRKREREGAGQEE